MRALRDGAEARDLIAAHFQPGVRTNHFLAPAELDGEIARGRLWASEWAGGVAFYHQKTGYWRLTFYLNDPEAPFGGALPPGPVAAEIAHRPGADREDSGFWLRQGFSLEGRRVRMVRERADPGRPPRWPVRRSTGADREAIAALLADRFHPYLGCIPEGEELTGLVSSGGFFVAGEGAVEGLVSLREERGHGQMRHLAVRRDREGLGLGGALVDAVSRAEARKRTLLWTAEREENLRLYGRHGYRSDGWQSDLLLYEP